MKKIAIVTGASRGIGAATAIRLAKENYDICVNYLNSEADAMNVIKHIEALGQRGSCPGGQATRSGIHRLRPDYCIFCIHTQTGNSIERN